MTKNIKILYLCPKNPFPCECGEDFGYAKDISEIAKSKYINNTLLVLGNINNKSGELPYDTLNYEIFQTQEKKLSPILKAIVYMYDIIFDKFPHSMTKFITKEMQKKINSYKADVIILDSIYSMAMLPKHNNYKIMYIAHNHETEFAFDIARTQKNIFKKVYFYLKALKIKNLEQELNKKAHIIVCVSTSDYRYFSKLYPEKTEFFAHNAETGNFSWNGNNKKTLLFCGPTCHYPNLEAIEWIANELSPALGNDIKIKIVGKGTSELSGRLNRSNIEYLGFISSEELKSLYQACSAFICPIIYGSGVKIKVTEALSYGTPIIATKESLEGLDYINILPLIDRNNIKQTKQNIETLLTDENKLKQYSNDLIDKLKQYKEKNKNTLEEMLDKII